MKTIICKLLIFTLVMIASNTFAQKKLGADTNNVNNKIKTINTSSLKFEMTLLIDNRENNDSFKLTITNMDNKVVTIINVNSNFILHLGYHSDYEIKVSNKNCGTKIVYFSTNAPYDNWYVITGVDLSSSQISTTYAGGIKYNKSLDTFEKY